MNLTLFIGIIWIFIAVYNYVNLPQETKDKTNLLSFIVFAFLSPIVMAFTLFEVYVLGNLDN